MAEQHRDIVDRTAVAIYDADMFLANRPTSWERLDATVKEKYRRMARGALAVALAEPPVPA